MNRTKETKELVEKFLVYVVRELEIESPAKIFFIFENNHESKENPSAGGYDPEGKAVVVLAKNRAIADVMRTLAHELTHHRQNEQGKIGPEDSDNQDLEDEANVMSGRLVRFFGRANKEIYSDIS